MRPSPSTLTSPRPFVHRDAMFEGRTGGRDAVSPLREHPRQKTKQNSRVLLGGGAAGAAAPVAAAQFRGAAGDEGPFSMPVMCDFAHAANHHRFYPVTTREGIPASMTTRMIKKKHS